MCAGAALSLYEELLYTYTSVGRARLLLLNVTTPLLHCCVCCLLENRAYINRAIALILDGAAIMYHSSINSPCVHRLGGSLFLGLGAPTRLARQLKTHRGS